MLCTDTCKGFKVLRISMPVDSGLRRKKICCGYIVVFAAIIGVGIELNFSCCWFLVD